VKRVRLFILVAAAMAVAQTASAAACPPCYSVPKAKLRASLHCPRHFTKKHEPVLLVHGTFTRGKVNYAWGYLASLRSRGFDVCYVDLPNGAMDDAQVSSEYVVFGVREMYARSGRRVDMLGVSQGGLEQRWAVKWWPDMRYKVDDVVMHATPNHGTFMQPSGPLAHCFASCWQMAAGSRFLRALNAGDETPGNISYTSIFTNFDELVQPQLPKSTSALRGARNIRVQDLCPGRPVDHVGISSDDAVSFALDVDAFTHPGPANPKRFDVLTCLQPVPSGNDPTAVPSATADYVEHFPKYHDRASEPALKRYAR
jgi:triacylglycerol lipase